jgi:hypothetical protein
MFVPTLINNRDYQNPISPYSVILPNDCDKNDSSWDDLKIRLGMKQPCPKVYNTVPLIVNKTRSNYFNNTPFYTVDVLPIIKNDYSDLNDDKNVIKTVTKYYYYKTIEKFLKSEMIDILGYIHISGDNVDFIKNIKDYTTKLPTESETKKKIDFIEDHFITKKMIHNILKKYVKKNNVMWYKVQQNEAEFKNHLHKKLKELIEDEIKS